MSNRLRIGQTSIILFASKVVSSALGFAATVYIARLLGADALGVYSIALTVVSLLGILGTMGVTSGIKKRVSEQTNPASYTAAGGTIMTILFIITSILIYMFRTEVSDYIGYPAAGYVVAMVGVLLAANVISAALNGQHLVHIAGILSTVHQGSRASVQIVGLAAGFGIAGMFGGYLVGYLIYISVGTVILVRSFEVFQMPRNQEFRRILSFAKYAWLGSLRTQAFNWVDIALLGAFVATSLVGYYTAAWNIAQFLAIFGGAISQAMFPKMSENAINNDFEAAADLLHTALAFSGLILIPGLTGSILLGESLLTIYSPEFSQAGLVLSILIGATLLQSYQKQLTTVLNALDYPDIAFRVNLVFILTNVVLNIIFIITYGWIGAATATAVSIGISLVVAYQYVNSLLNFQTPVGEIMRQWLAAGVMCLLLTTLLRIQERYLATGDNLAIVVVLIIIGAMLYFITLLGVSKRFRTTVLDNIPDREVIMSNN